MSSARRQPDPDLLALWQEQLAQKDAQIASLTSLLQSANERLADQQRLWETYLAQQVQAQAVTQERAVGMDRPRLVTYESRPEPSNASEVADASASSKPPPMSSTDLIKMYEAGAKPAESPPERPPIPMSYFGAPMVGMALAVTAAVAKGAGSSQDANDEKAARYLEPPRLSPPESESAYDAFGTDQTAELDEEPLNPANGSLRQARWIIPVGIVAVAGIIGGVWWSAVHSEASNRKTVPLASEVRTPEPQTEVLKAHRTFVARQPPVTDPSALNSDLVTAVTNADLPGVQAILQQGADVNARNAQGATALMIAARYGILPAAEALLAHGADINATNKAGWNALLLAVRYDRMPIVRTLLTHGVRVNDSNQQGATPLMLAAQLGETDAVTLLLAQGADVKIKNSLGQTARDLAARKGHDQIAKLLDQSAARN